MADHPLHPDIRLLDGRWYASDPQAHWDWMRANAPVYRDPDAGIWAVALHEDVMAVSKDWQTFSSAQGMHPEYGPVPNMICMDDPQHRLRRGLVNSGFTRRRVEDHEPKIREICRGLIGSAASRGRFDFVHDVAAPLPMIVIGDMLGVPPEDRDQLLRWSDDLMKGLTGTGSLTREIVERGRVSIAEYRSYAAEVVKRRRKSPGADDLMDVLVHADIDGERLDDTSIVEESLLILTGGDETTRHVISGGMYELLRHPEQRRRLAAEPARIPTAVEEMLRWVTPIKTMSRTLTRDVELRGQKLRCGEKLILLYPSANRDERVFADPHRFDSAREPNDHVAFGGYGAHFCLGASLARLELRVMFEEILASRIEFELESDARPPLRPANFVVGYEEMAVRVA